MEPANDIQVRIALLAIFMQLRPGIGRKGKVHRPVISRHGRHRRQHIDKSLTLPTVGATQQSAANFMFSAGAMRGDLFQGQLGEKNSDFITAGWTAMQDDISSRPVACAPAAPPALSRAAQRLCACSVVTSRGCGSG